MIPEPACCRSSAPPASDARRPSSKPSSRSRPTVRSPPLTAMSISAPAFAPRSGRSSPKNSTCPLRASSWCSAIPRAFPIRARRSPARPSRSPRYRCARPPRRRGNSCWRAPRERLELPLEDLAIEDGLIRGHDNRSISYGELIADETIRLELADDVPVKSTDSYTHRRPIGAARRSSGQGDRRACLCARRARARHAARPRGAPALCRRRCRRLRRHQPDRRR